LLRIPEVNEMSLIAMIQVSFSRFFPAFLPAGLKERRDSVEIKTPRAELSPLFCSTSFPDFDALSPVHIDPFSRKLEAFMRFPGNAQGKKPGKEGVPRSETGALCRPASLREKKRTS
jgi:hypothetical protein